MIFALKAIDPTGLKHPKKVINRLRLDCNLPNIALKTIKGRFGQFFFKFVALGARAEHI